ncbi:MAG TPA: YCF48-related protein [Planctomycetaceae bacterium]|nr:YCF48-related protein [Planctomycetaceae bacterium]
MDIWRATRCVALTLAIALALAADHPAAAQSSSLEQARVPAVTPSSGTPPVDDSLRDDANLHDVCFVGSRDGWSVGDHGAVWRTEDGGRTWKLLPCPVDCALRSVCFVTDRIGWVAGGSTTAFTRVGMGVILATRDGGKTWTSLARGSRPLPQLHYVRFFSPSAGVVVGEPTPDFPSGVITTSDAGKTWQSVDGGRHDGWRAADFLAPTLGALAGLEGESARVDGGRVIDLRAGRFGLRGLYDVKLSRDDSGWMVGDGALILRTHNRGVVWEAPPTLLPKEAGEIFNFHAIAVRGARLWIAGSPGSIVWHSPDGGRSWRAQSTGQTAPLERLAFSTDESGCAVGVFGCILHTEDGGQTWEPARAAKRRAALLTVQSRPDRISFGALAKESGDLGYRSVVLLPVRGQAEGEGARDPGLDLKLHDAVTVAGGSQGATGWRFPLDIPGLERDPEKLVADWMRRSEGRFQPMFYGDLVCQLRMWRPTVVIIDQPALDDAPGTVLANAVLAAVRQAGDPLAFAEQARVAGLPPWTTERVFMRLPTGSAGDCRLDVDEILPRRGSTVMSLAAGAASRLIPAETVPAESESYRLVDVAPGADGANGNLPVLQDFFTGIGLGPGTDARRSLKAINRETNDPALRIARRDRNFRAMIRQRVHGATGGSELLGMLHDQTSGSDNASAALQLVLLADAYRRNAQWELAEAVVVDLVERFPDEPATFNAMQWLFQYWTSAELTYQRLRQESAQTTRMQFTPSDLQTKIDKAFALAQTDPKDRDPAALDGPDPLRFVTTPGRLRLGKSDLGGLRWAGQRDSALKIAALIRRKSPALYRTPAIQFPLAALLRQSGMTTLPSEVGAHPGVIQASATETDAEHGDSTAGASLATAQIGERLPQKTIVCLAAKERLKPDGLLSDACWQEAVEIPLSTSTVAIAGNAPHAYVMLAHDAQYLYFAASVPRVSGLPKDGPMTLGRKHDQDLSAYDRISLFFDVDRDGVTWYEIDIDQRGCVAESCWNDPRWNPPMAVAADGDDERWRIEGMIPFSEMVPQPPRVGEGWGLAIVRTAPTVKQEAWIPPASTRPRPESFGLLRFQ